MSSRCRPSFLCIEESCLSTYFKAQEKAKVLYFPLHILENGRLGSINNVLKRTLCWLKSICKTASTRIQGHHFRRVIHLLWVGFWNVIHEPVLLLQACLTITETRIPRTHSKIFLLMWKHQHSGLECFSFHFFSTKVQTGKKNTSGKTMFGLFFLPVIYFLTQEYSLLEFP